MTYLPNTDADRQAMLRAIGLESVAPLFERIPKPLRDPPLQLPEPLSEMELWAEFQQIAADNQCHAACFCGAGVYRHFVPSAVRALTSRGEFYTCYTPYQPEVSQGTLQAIFEYQSLVCRLTGMDVTNASMYDGASALAEAALMATSITGRRQIVVAATVHPEYQRVLATYLGGREFPLAPAGRLPAGVLSPQAAGERVDGSTAALLVQHPNSFGCLEDLAALAEVAHRQGALLVVHIDPISLGLLRPPSLYGADIVTGEGQPLGLPPSFGGPFLGILACRERYLRQIPGRLVGMTHDDRGQRAYVLTLQAREQHIRRERAGSNICTNEGLCALAAAVYLSLMGRQGLRRVAELCLQKAHYAAQQITSLPGFSLAFGAPFFQEFAVRCPRPPAELRRRLLERGILAGVELGRWYPELADCLLLCVTEMNIRSQIDALVAGLREAAA